MSRDRQPSPFAIVELPVQCETEESIEKRRHMEALSMEEDYEPELVFKKSSFLVQSIGAFTPVNESQCDLHTMWGEVLLINLPREEAVMNLKRALT